MVCSRARQDQQNTDYSPPVDPSSHSSTCCRVLLHCTYHFHDLSEITTDPKDSSGRASPGAQTRFEASASPVESQKITIYPRVDTRCCQSHTTITFLRYPCILFFLFASCNFCQLGHLLLYMNDMMKLHVRLKSRAWTLCDAIFQRWCWLGGLVEMLITR